MAGGGYLTIEYQAPGQRVKQATHGFQVGDNNVFTTFDEEAWYAIGGARLLTEDINDLTDPAGDGANPQTLIEVLLGFHRYLQGAHVAIVGVRAHDGPTPGVGEGNHAGWDTNLQCRGLGLPENPSTQNNFTMGPGNAGMLIDKAPGVFSGSGGRLWLRYAMQLTHTMVADNDGVACIPAQVELYKARTLAAQQPDGWAGIGGRQLSEFMGAGYTYPAGGAIAEGMQVAYIIPKTVASTYVRPDGSQGKRRLLIGGQACGGFTFSDFQSRDAKRQGKRAR